MTRIALQTFLAATLIALAFPTISSSESRPSDDLKDAVASANVTLTNWLTTPNRGRAPVELAEFQPGSHQANPLWNLARRACSGVITRHLDIAQATGVDVPLHLFAQHPMLENVGIADGFCPEDGRSFTTTNVVFLVGHYVDGGIGYYYKTSPEGEGIMDAAVCPYQEKCSAIQPVRIEAGRKIYSQAVQKDYDQVLQRVVSYWGNPSKQASLEK